ncbi:MAG: bacillithiol biosynthesis cysteine-adding enzyme BshC, partial [Candidatus Binatia bacterium]
MHSPSRPGSAAAGTAAGAPSGAVSPRPFAPAWLGGDAAAARFLARGFGDAGERTKSVERASRRGCPAGLVEALARQHLDLPASGARARNLEALAAGKAAVVVSGQQVGLFTGPAFSFYKAAGVVAAARRLEAESGLPCVPVFWLQTEDHDWEEIDHCVVLDHHGAVRRISAGGGDAPPRASVAARRFDATIAAALAELEAAVGPRPNGAEAVALMARHYRAGASPAAAFRGVLDELFGGDGLLVLDPRTPEMAALAAPVLERALLDAESIGEMLGARARDLEGAGFAVQVKVLDGSPLCFFHPGGAEGDRFRLEACEGGWRLRGHSRDAAAPDLAREEAARLVVSDPLRFSSSALLRPLVQDYLLPTAVVLGGPGEIGYFAQLAPLYDAMGHALPLEMPLVAPRPSFCVTTAGDRRRLEALGTTFAALAGDREEVLGRLPAATSARVDADGVEEALLGGFLSELEGFAGAAIALDENLRKPVDKARDSVRHTVHLLVERYRKSALQHDSVLVERLDRLRAALAPGGVPQERVHGLASLAAEHGVAG